MQHKRFDPQFMMSAALELIRLLRVHVQDLEQHSSSSKPISEVNANDRN